MPATYEDLRHCGCMDGPSDPDPACLYCGGTGVWVSDERLEQLRDSYGYLSRHPDGSPYYRDFRGKSDLEHVAIIRALQQARRAQEPNQP